MLHSLNRKKTTHKIRVMFQGYYMESEKLQGQTVCNTDAASQIRERLFLSTVDMNPSVVSALKGKIT